MPVRDATVDDLKVIHELIHDLAAYEQLSGHAVSTIEDLRRHLFGADPAASVLIAEDAREMWPASPGTSGRSPRSLDARASGSKIYSYDRRTAAKDSAESFFIG